MLRHSARSSASPDVVDGSMCKVGLVSLRFASAFIRIFQSNSVFGVQRPKLPQRRDKTAVTSLPSRRNAMLYKCANEACSAPFRRLREGKLFQVETEYLAQNQGTSAHRRTRPWRRVEHYWLCDACSTFITLTFDRERGVITVPLPPENLSVPGGFGE